MPYDFKDQVILITGAGGAIGRTTAIKLASLNATLSLCDIDYDALQTTSKACQGAACPPYLSDVDVSDVKEVTTLIESTLKKFKRLDHVFNCASINPTSIPLEETPDDYWDQLVNTNLKGLFHVTRAAIPHLKKGSSFVNVASVGGLRGTANQAVYCATKCGVIGFSRSVALELGPRGIRCNVVAPGFNDAPRNAESVDGKSWIVEGTALPSLGTPREVADIVAFLMSSDASGENGSVIS